MVISFRQAAVLTMTALMAPAADLLPGLLTRQVGRAAWLVPLLALPVVLLWLVLLYSLFYKEGSDLGGELKRRFGSVLGRGVILLYIMWGTLLLAQRVSHASLRLGRVYSPGTGVVFSAAVVGLALWMVWRSPEGLFRAGEIFWLVGAVAVGGVLLLSLPQLRTEWLVPDRSDWEGLPSAWRDCVGVFSGGVLSCALIGKSPREKRGRKRLAGWGCVICLIAAGITAAVLGQIGRELTAKLDHPFLVMVQGLSLEGGFARLEAPVAALWLVTDFAGAGLVLGAVRTLAGERAGRWIAALCALLAVLGQGISRMESWTIFGNWILGIGVPALLWVLSRIKRNAG